MCWLEEGHPMLTFLQGRKAVTRTLKGNVHASFRMHGLSKPVFGSATSRPPLALAGKVCLLARGGT